MKEQLDAIEKSVEEIKLAIKGDESIGVKGIVKKIGEHDRYIQEDKKFKQKAIGAIMVIAFLGTGLWQMILNAGSYIIHVIKYISNH